MRNLDIKVTDNLTTIATKKFKTTIIKMSFKSELNRENITSRVLLPSVLRNSTMKFPSKKELNAHLENLYGASLSAGGSKQGKGHVISFYVSIANEKFLHDAPNLLEEGMQLLEEVIFNPLVTDGAFNSEKVSLEKRLLKEDIEAIYDDKTSYALKKLIENMCENEAYGVQSSGYIDDLPSIDEKSLYQTYKSMLEDDAVSISVIGDIDHDQVLPKLRHHFNSVKNKSLIFDYIDREEKSIRSGEVPVITEKQNVNQMKLNIGYRTNTRIADEDYFSLLVFNGVFGGFAHSKLFMNVREKASLCYYCASRLDNFKGLMYVYSGLDANNYNKAVEIIDEQMLEMVQGRFTEKELELAKKSLINAKLESLDSAGGMLSERELAEIWDMPMTTSDFVSRVSAVTAEDVQKMAKKIEKDSVFVLTGGEGLDGNS